VPPWIGSPRVPFALGILLAALSSSALGQDRAWTRQFGTAERESVEAVAADGFGHVYVGGTTAGALPGQQSKGGSDGFLAQYDVTGNQVWLTQFGTGTDDTVRGIAADPLGRIYVVGGRRTDVNGPPTFQAYIALYDVSGNQLWLQRLEDAITTSISAVVADDTGAYVGGSTSTRTNGFSGLFLARFDAAGNELWMRSVVAPVRSIALDRLSGDIYAAGGIPSATIFDAVVARYDSSGTPVWARTFATVDGDSLNSIAVDSVGHIYVVGISGSIEPEAVYLIQYDTAGNQTWIREFEDIDDFPPGLSAVVTDASGNAFVVGGTGAVLFVAKYDPAGNRLWARQFPNASGRAASIDETNALYIGADSFYGASPIGDQDAVVARLVEPASPFSTADIGEPGASGSAEFAGGRVTVRAAGRDIWGTADAFSWTSTQVAGDFDAVVRVTSVEHVHDWTKAGLMIRQALSPDAPHVFLFATPTPVNGIAFQRRRAEGDSTVHTSGPAMAPPAWLKLSRRGNTVHAWSRASAAEPWTFVGTDASGAFGPTLFVGLAVTSHRDGVLATATFEDLSISPAEVVPFADIGDVGAPGSADFDGTTFIVRGSGADIWSTADAFGWTSGRFAGDFDAIAQVTSLADVHQWTKAGVMIRANSSPSAPHMSLFVTPANGLAFQRRLASGGATTHTAGPAVTAPVWLKLSRRGDTVYAAYRVSRTDPWTLIASDRSASIASPLLVGLAVTSHARGTIATATFEHVDVDVVSLLSSTVTNIGDVGIPGKVETDTIATRITASGHDIWGTADAFSYQSRHWTGDGVVTARVLAFDAAHPWAKAGVMFRQSVDADAPHAMVIVSAQQGVSLQYRDVRGGRSFQAGNVAGAAPAWVRLTRRGDQFIGEMSVDGVAWTTIGSVTLPMAFEVRVGLAVTSHDNAASATAAFDDVAIE
jgi:hypothetical protein